MNSTDAMEGAQVGGDHYQHPKQARWALLHFALARGYDIPQFQMLRYLDRWRRKGGVTDLYKMRDYLQEVIRVEEERLESTPSVAPMADPFDAHLARKPPVPEGEWYNPMQNKRPDER